MSKIAADVLRAETAAAETPMIYPVRGSAKSWCNLNGTGTVAVRASLNVSSLLDAGAGNYTIYYTSVMLSVNYAPEVAGGTGSSGLFTTQVTVVAANYLAVGSINHGANVFTDLDLVFGGAKGDLA